MLQNHHRLRFPEQAGDSSTHGAPLGDEEIAASREALDWDSPPFEIPAEISGAWDANEQGSQREGEWDSRFARIVTLIRSLQPSLTRRMQGALPDNWSEHADAAVAAISDAAATMATRKASLVALNAFAPALPELAGGSADLTGSNLTKHEGSVPISGDDAAGNYIYFGVREFGMSAICNGMRLHGGVIPYSGTFLTFLGLRAQCIAHGCPDAGAEHFRLYARLNRSRRRRPDASACRTCCQPANHAKHARLAALRHGRNRGRVARCARTPGWSDQPGADASGSAASGAICCANCGHRQGRIRIAGLRRRACDSF